eukprot:gnl/MRDRNA2_/MRDRNA2_30660_c0_seq1.p1 gnl/MRDRNA2_/MRDRNA2_30660_c0~~gnl/MRDRNA2_/MRDRNA2_30660_c0_seq1.p1  ORF type:complete len:780 (+),score=91.66 gnl/MRDRNA2_/MRDRNA2_30660_c0_seq1:25-2364(+)
MIKGRKTSNEVRVQIPPHVAWSPGPSPGTPGKFSAWDATPVSSLSSIPSVSDIASTSASVNSKQGTGGTRIEQGPGWFQQRERRPSLVSLTSQSSTPLTPISEWGRKPAARRPSISSVGSQMHCASLAAMDALSAPKQSAKAIKSSVIKSQTKVRDGSEVYSVSMIICAILVAACCGVAGFTLHLSVFFFGCLGGVNGCKESVVLDVLKPFGINKSLYFIVSCGMSGLLCSCILYSPWKRGIAKNCLGGGAAGTKIAISCGQPMSIWIVVFRILLAGLYLGGGNALGTEGPVIHMGTALATYLTSFSGTRSRKIFSMFGVIGASAGISAGFSVLITGFIYTTEEITRSLSRRLSLILTLASAVAFLVKNTLEHALEHWLHIEHVSLTPHKETLQKLSSYDAWKIIALCIPIGILNGLAGWCLTQLAWRARGLLNRAFLPRWSHLAIIGVVTGCFGAIAYESTGMNGVWGTTIGAIPETIAHGITWKEALILFLMKFLSFALATAGGGPGGMLVPSLVAGGFLGVAIGLLVSDDDAFVSASAVVGMGSLFASVMHLPVSGIIIIFELTQSTDVILPVVIANFISSNVAARLPHGEHSFAHLMLEHDPMWEKVGKQDFIETDAQETSADTSVGYGKLPSYQKNILREFFQADRDRLSQAWEAWRTCCDQWSGGDHSDSESSDQNYEVVGACEQLMSKLSTHVSLRIAWTAWLLAHRLKDQGGIYDDYEGSHACGDSSTVTDIYVSSEQDVASSIRSRKSSKDASSEKYAVTEDDMKTRHLE